MRAPCQRTEAAANLSPVDGAACRLGDVASCLASAGPVAESGSSCHKDGKSANGETDGEGLQNSDGIGDAGEYTGDLG
jgi:hypothetical protein